MPRRKRNKIFWMRFLTRGRHPLLYTDPVMIAHKDLFHKYFRLPKITHWARHSGSLWVDQKEMEEIFKQIHKKLYTNWPSQVLKKMQSDLKLLNRYAEKLNSDYVAGKPININQLQRVYKLMSPAWMATYFPIILGKVVEEETNRRINNLPKEQQNKIGQLIVTPLYPPVQQRYFEELRHPGQRPTKKAIENIFKKYGHIKSYLMEIKPLTLKAVQNDIKAIKNKIKLKTKNRPLRLGNKLSKLIRLGRLYCWFRDWRLFEITKCFYFLKPLLENYGKNLGMSYKELCQLRLKEFFTKEFKLTNLRQRQKGYAILLTNNNIKVISGKHLGKITKQINERINKGGLFKGTIGNNGVARGRVWIADAYSFSKPHKGNILVTAETTPDSLPYIRTVKAIVTDEGGITSHAAIISRELDIPCIVGTKFATRVLKDGDLVEVDANKGIVKVLKKR